MNAGGDENGGVDCYGGAAGGASGKKGLGKNWGIGARVGCRFRILRDFALWAAGSRPHVSMGLKGRFDRTKICEKDLLSQPCPRQLPAWPH